MPVEAPSFEPLAHPTPETLGAYLDHADQAHLQEILEKTLNHRASLDGRRLSHREDRPRGFEEYVNARRGDHAEHRPFGGEASIKEEARAEWAGQLGLSLDDIRALQEISQRFTAAYNAAYGTDLSQQAGRSILLKLSRADQLGERISTESKRRQEVLRTHDLTRLDRDSRLIPVDTFLSGLNARDRAVWDEIPQNGAFVESNTDEELHMYRKTASGDCVRTRLLPRIEPLFIAGFPCLSANDICSSLDRDSGLRVLFSPSCPYANNTFHDYSELTRLFRSIERITTAS